MSGKSYGNKNEFIYIYINQYIHIADGRNFIKFPLSKSWLSNDTLVHSEIFSRHRSAPVCF